MWNTDAHTAGASWGRWSKANPNRFAPTTLMAS